jgi:hypothetical protein
MYSSSSGMAMREWAFSIKRRSVVPDRLAPTMNRGASIRDESEQTGTSGAVPRKAYAG